MVRHQIENLEHSRLPSANSTLHKVHSDHPTHTKRDESGTTRNSTSRLVVVSLTFEAGAAHNVTHHGWWVSGARRGPLARPRSLRPRPDALPAEEAHVVGLRSQSKRIDQQQHRDTATSPSHTTILRGTI